MKLPAILAVLAFALLLKEDAADTLKVVKASEVQWVDAKGAPRGVKHCLVHGDPAKGSAVMLSKIPAGTTLPPHTHSSDEVISIVSGSCAIAAGEKVDESKAKVVGSGGYFTIKARTPHWAIAKTETVLVRYLSGPVDIQYVNPADDPGTK